MSTLAVIIPSWNQERALSLIDSLDWLGSTGEVSYYVIGVSRPGDFMPSASRWILPSQPLAPVEAMARGAYEALSASELPDLLVFLHDDVELNKSALGWDQQLLDHFSAHPKCGLAGFGGSLGFATDSIYKEPYDYRQLARVDFVSNMWEAEQHGRRVTRATQVAALDGFSLVCSQNFYTRPQPEGGTFSYGLWDACLRDGIPFHMYDAWISCLAFVLGYETWMLPLPVHHAGGRTSVGEPERYSAVCERLGYASPEDLYEKAHRVIYERFQRVLPIRVPIRNSRSSR